MYIPKQYSEYSCITEYGYKNPALCRVNGVLTSYCCLCRQYIGNEYDTDFHKLIRREYCRPCADQVRVEQSRERQRNHRRSKKQMKKEHDTKVRLLEQQIRLLQQNKELTAQENKLLREMVATLRDDVDQLKNRKV